MPFNSTETSDAFRLGFFCFRDKIDEAENPYPFGVEDYVEWRRGWYKAKNETSPRWWRSGVFWSGVFFLVIGVAIVSLELPFIQNNPRYAGSAIIIYGIASIFAKIVGQTPMHSPQVFIPPLMLKKKNDKTTSKKDN